MYYNTIGIQLTDRCNCFCKMCIANCSGKNKNKLSEQDIDSIIFQASGMRDIKQIVFSGGDPFIYFDLLLYGLDCAYKAGLSSACFTNAYWCTDREKTEAIVRRLAKSHLGTLQISIDSEHNRFISIENYKNLLAVLKKTSIRVSIHAGMSAESYTENLLKSLKPYLIGYSVVIFPFLPFGRAQSLKECYFGRVENKYDTRCPYDSVLAIRADGSVYGCDMCFVESRTMGNIHAESILNIIKRIRRDEYYKKIVQKGLTEIMMEAEEKAGMQIPDRLTSPCEFCNNYWQLQEQD